MVFKFEEKYLLDLYNKNEFEKLSKKFLEIIDLIFQVNFQTYKNDIQKFVLLFIEIFTKDNFILPINDRVIYILNNRRISILLQNSKFKNSDTFLEKLLSEINIEKNKRLNKLCKVLTLYSNQNRIEVDYKNLFDIDPELATYWYFNYIENLSIFNTKQKYERTKTHLEQFFEIEENISYASPKCTHIYFKSSYLSKKLDKVIKKKINILIKEQVNSIKLKNLPKKNEIAIVTAKWQKGHPVYRSQFSYLKEVSKTYKLSLINLNKQGISGDTGIFERIININLEEDNSINLDQIENNDFSIVYYPDLGFNFESIFLSNIRIAPIQISSYGHPVSSFGSEIDFWIGGESLENRSDDDYSEKLILAEGSSFYPEKPEYKEENFEYKEKKEFVITLPWSPQKILYPDLFPIKEIIKKSPRKVKVVVFTLFKIDGIEYISFKNELIKTLRTRSIELINYTDYQKYMEIINYSDLVINASFGGYTITIDSLIANTIIITKKNSNIASLLSPLVLKNLGLDELISNNNDELIDNAVSIISNSSYRRQLINKIQNTDIISELRKKENKESFKKVFSNLIENVITNN